MFVLLSTLFFYVVVYSGLTSAVILERYYYNVKSIIKNGLIFLKYTYISSNIIFSISAPVLTLVHVYTY